MAEPSANVELGDAAYGSDPGTVTYESGEAITAGDSVAINSGQLATADGTTDTEIIGIAAEDGTSGEDITVYVPGNVIVANVAGGITAGAALTTSATEGQLASGSGSYVALSDEGAMAGLSHGAGLEANSAVVLQK